MQTKTITLDGQDYTVAPIRTGDAKTMRASAAAVEDYNIAFVAASLKAGGDSSASIDSVSNLPYFAVFLPLLAAANEVNGLVTPAGEGEAAPAPAAADSTSDSSTAQ